jgi:hypothetical protein
VSWETTALTTIEAYDTKTNKWRKVPDMPTPRFLLAVEAVGGWLYAIGGSTTDWATLATVEAFKP